MWGVSLISPAHFYLGSYLTRPALFYNVGSLFYTPSALLSGEFLLHAPCYVTCGVSLTSPVLFYAGGSLTRPLLFYVGSFLTHPMLFYMGSLSYTPHAMLCGEFLLQAQCYFMSGVSLTHPMLCYMGSFSYTPLCLSLIHISEPTRPP